MTEFNQQGQQVGTQNNAEIINFFGQGTAVSRPYAQLPRDIGDFTGRRDELVEIKHFLDAGGQGTALVISAVAGMGGVGKTALAIHAAHHLKEQFTGGQLYVNLQGVAQGVTQLLEPAQVLDQFLRALGVEGNGIPLELEARAGLYRSLLDKKRVLVVLDNARDKQQVEPLLPGCGSCGVLITSRQKLASLAGARFLDLAVMTPEDGLELLGKFVGERVATEPEAAREIVKLCGRLPLAIRIAGGTLGKRHQWNLQEYVGRLRNERTRLAKLTLDDLDVRASFNLSYQELAEDAARLFRLLGSLLGADFGLAVAQVLDQREQEEVEESLLMLQDAQLLEVSREERYRFHDLVRLFAGEQLQKVESPEEQAGTRARVAQWYRVTSYERDAWLRADRRWELAQVIAEQTGETVEQAGERLFAQGLRWFEQEQENLLAEQTWAHEAQDWQQVWRLADNLVVFFNLRSQWSAWEASHLLALKATRQLKDLPGEMKAFNDLGLVYDNQGWWDEAIEYYEKSLDICRALGDRHTERMMILGNLGSTYQHQGRWEEAIGCYEQSLHIFRALKDLYREGQTLGNLGLVYNNQCRWEEAIECHEKSLVICRALGDRHGEGLTLNSLGIVYKNQGKWDEAIEFYEKSLEICRVLKDLHGEGTTLANLGNLHKARGEEDKAIAFFQEALTKLHPDSPEYRKVEGLLGEAP